MRFYGEIRRVDEEKRMVWGYASTPKKATDGKTITLDAMRGALDDYMTFANIREMHQPSAVGVAEEAKVDKGGMYIGAKVVDDTAWLKVKEKVYKGFSIGAKVTSRDPNDDNLITGIKLFEISLVDRPADAGAVFDVWRASQLNDEDEMADHADEIDRRAFTEEERKKLAKSGEAMPDGSFPIQNRADLENAIRAWGRAKNKYAVKKHIEKRAKALDAEDLIPADWKKDGDKDAKRAEGAADGDGSAETIERTGEAAEAAEDAPAAEDNAAVEGQDDLVTRATQAAAAAVAGATSALDRAETAVQDEETVARAELPNAEIRRGMPAVTRLNWLLSELAYLVCDAQWESEIEGDNSPVPGKLRAAMLELAKAYKAMSDEELAELLKGVDVDVAIEEGVIQLCASGADLERINGAFAETLKRLGHEAPAAATDNAAPAQTEEITRLSASVETITAQRDTLLRSVGDLTTQVTQITERLDRLSKEPRPARTAGSTHVAVSKENDSAINRSDTGNTADGAAVTPEDVQRFLATLTPDERAVLLIRAAHARPIAISRS